MDKKNIFEKIKDIPRRHYIKEATPLQRLDVLSKALGGKVEVYIKRDDMLPYGGNKVRKLEFLFQEAVDYGANAIITGSTVQCSHNLMALLIANKEGMKTSLILETWAKSDYEYDLDPNRHLYEIGGAGEIIKSSGPVTGPLDEMEIVLKTKEDMEDVGMKPYIMARGGTCPLGNCGYVLCMEEIIRQANEINLDFDYLVCPSGTGGTQTGLLVGLEEMNYPACVLGINVSKSKERQLKKLYQTLDQTAGFLNIKIPDINKVICYDGYYGEGYAKPTNELKEAIKLVARTEGIMLDPVYSGKTMAGLIGLIRNGDIEKGSKVIFLHTGGFTTYYDYSSIKELPLEGDTRH